MLPKVYKLTLKLREAKRQAGLLVFLINMLNKKPEKEEKDEALLKIKADYLIKKQSELDYLNEKIAKIEKEIKK